MNYYKAAENLLLSVQRLNASLENLKIRQEKIKQIPQPVIKNYNKSSEISNAVERTLEATEIKQDKEYTEYTLESIKSILEQLSYEEKQILQLWYIEKQSKEKILVALHIESLTTLYKLRNRAVANFALLYYGAKALNSI